MISIFDTVFEDGDFVNKRFGSKKVEVGRDDDVDDACVVGSNEVGSEMSGRVAQTLWTVVVVMFSFFNIV